MADRIVSLFETIVGAIIAAFILAFMTIMGVAFAFATSIMVAFGFITTLFDRNNKQ